MTRSNMQCEFCAEPGIAQVNAVSATSLNADNVGNKDTNIMPKLEPAPEEAMQRGSQTAPLHQGSQSDRTRCDPRQAFEGDSRPTGTNPDYHMSQSLVLGYFWVTTRLKIKSNTLIIILP